MRWAIALVAVLLGIAAAYAQFNGCGDGLCPNQFGSADGFSRPAGAGVPAQTGLILQTDGASRILQTDGTSRICLAGGC